MLTIIHNENYYTLPYNPTQTLLSLKHDISLLTHISPTSILLTHNTVPLSNDTSSLQDLISDNTTLHVSYKPPSSQNSTQNLESIVDMFPELKSEIKKNKHLKEFVQSGNLADEFDKMSKNPKYMNEQLRSIDLAMSKLENIPGGLNMMSSMVNEVNEPLTDIFKSKGKNVKEGVKSEYVNKEQMGNRKENLKLKYAVQLGELKKLEFRDVERNVEVLRITEGDLERAICMLAEENEE